MSPSIKISLSAVFQIFICLSCFAQSSIIPTYLRTEYKVNPYTDVSHPRLSWELDAKNLEEFQTAYQVLVASSQNLLDEDEGDLWDSGKMETNASNQIVYNGKTLAPKTRVYWKVRSWDKTGESGKWSQITWWETGLLDKEDWEASWIGYSLNEYGRGKIYHLPPAPYLRKEYQIRKKIQSARLYVTSLGVYEFFINGKRVGNDYFAPGWTDYNKRVYYNIYDVKKLLKSGKNAFSATLSYGWYSGYLGYALLVKSPQVRNFYGDVPLVKAQLEISYTDGSKELIVTNDSWKASQGALRETDFQHGETYDARLKQDGWDKIDFDDSKWNHAEIYTDSLSRKVQLHPGNPIKVITTLAPKTIKAKGEGRYIIDFGQNFAGVVQLKVKGTKGDTIVLRYGEKLHLNGDLMTENLRKARSTDTYILRGDRNGEEWQPQFTSHGFQFVEVSGLRKSPEKNFLTGIVLSSATPDVGKFETDNNMLNQLYSNIVWTQRANHIDIPTDCPQRDERLGWTGDAQIYIHSSTFNSDVSAFHTKWLADLNDSQFPNGAYPIYSPMPLSNKGQSAIRESDSYSPGWSEAGIICVYEMYRTYGDLRMVEQSFPYMKKFMNFLDQKAKGSYVIKEGSFDEIKPKGGYGDWLSIGKKTATELLATLYYGYCARLMEEMATAIGKKEDAQHYSLQKQSIKKAFISHYTNSKGRFKVDTTVYGNGSGYIGGNLGFDGHTQTAYANAIYMDMLDKEDRGNAGKWLKELVQSNDNKISTGFLGFRPLLPALSATGNTDLAYRLLLSTEYPSLGFEVINGATSIWERWDSYTTDKGFVHNASMNSFSHYAFGAVNEWMFGNMAGIKTDGSGYRRLVIRPEVPNSGIQNVKAEYHSINGWIKSSWKKENKRIIQDINIPVNTSANVYILATRVEDVRINGKNLSSSKWIKRVRTEDGMIIIEIGSGKFKFSSKQPDTKP